MKMSLSLRTIVKSPKLKYYTTKPKKYGIKVWMAAQSKKSYMINYDVSYGNENGFQRIHGLP